MQKIKINRGTFKGKIYFFSDFHENHQKYFLLQPRNFIEKDDRKDAHDKFPEASKRQTKWFFDHWNNTITEEDIVFNLGDTCFGDPTGERFDTISKLPCKHHYVLNGNHMSGHKSCYEQAKREFLGPNAKCNPHQEIYPLSYNNVTFLGDVAHLSFGRDLFVLSHFPFKIWDKMGKGVSHLSGHSHGNDKDRLVDSQTGKTLDVGIEVAQSFNNSPFFSLEEIVSIMGNKEQVLHDHHDQKTT